MKIDWVRKLTSRKFWAAVTSFVTMLIIYFGGSENKASQTAALIMAGASVVAYIIGEGMADAGSGTATLEIPVLQTGDGKTDDPEEDDGK